MSSVDSSVSSSSSVSSTSSAPSPTYESAIAQWQSIALPAHDKNFNITFNMAAGANMIDSVTALSANPATAYTQLSAVLRFFTNGFIEANNSSTVNFVSSGITYQANTLYRVEMSVNTDLQRYSVRLTPPSGAAVLAASNFVFRAAAQNLNYLNIIGTNGTHTVSALATAAYNDLASVSVPPSSSSMSSVSSSTSSLLPPTPGSTVNCASITRLAITWTFDQSYPCGQYVNGDRYVVAPNGIRITNISPMSIVSGGRTINGSTINPEVGQWTQHGFDSMMAGVGLNFVPSMNAGRPNERDISATNPSIVPAGSSFISSISHPNGENRPTLTDISILTVVAVTPLEGSFRPPYAGDDKTAYWQKSQLDYSKLQNVTFSGGPSLDGEAAKYARPWFEYGTEQAGRYYHPANHQPEYGLDMGTALGQSILTLHINATDAQKEKLVIPLVQFGIDLYGAATTGAIWAGAGGLNAGRKGPLVLAGIMLNDSKILAYADAKRNKIFAEDRQTWYVSNGANGTVNDVGRVMFNGDGRQRDTYTDAHVGLAEWGEKHDDQPERDASNWSAYYRSMNYIAHLSETLGIRMLSGGRAAWNWPAFFDYQDRAWENASGEMYAFPAAMWREFRANN